MIDERGGVSCRVAAGEEGEMSEKEAVRAVDDARTEEVVRILRDRAINVNYVVMKGMTLRDLARRLVIAVRKTDLELSDDDLAQLTYFF
jgi:hypothetical protein